MNNWFLEVRIELDHVAGVFQTHGGQVLCKQLLSLFYVLNFEQLIGFEVSLFLVNQEKVMGLFEWAIVDVSDDEHSQAIVIIFQPFEMFRLSLVGVQRILWS